MTIIQPFGERVLVKIITPEEKTSGGLLVHPVSKELSNKGIVVAVGEGTTLNDGTVKPLSVTIGDEILFQLGTGIDFNNGKDSYKILQIRDILGKFIEKGK